MSVLIKGMKMPENCLSCRFLEVSSAYGDFCVLRKKTVKGFNSRLKGCPLIELPPHGRLIDAEALIMAGHFAYAYGEKWEVMGLYPDDIKFKTLEEAKAWWEEWEKTHAEAEDGE